MLRAIRCQVDAAGLPFRHDSLDAAPRIGNVTPAPWNDVDVSVQDRLAGCWSVIDAHVEAIGTQL